MDNDLNKIEFHVAGEKSKKFTAKPNANDTTEEGKREIAKEFLGSAGQRTKSEPKRDTATLPELSKIKLYRAVAKPHKLDAPRNRRSNSGANLKSYRVTAGKSSVFNGATILVSSALIENKVQPNLVTFSVRFDVDHTALPLHCASSAALIVQKPDGSLVVEERDWDVGYNSVITSGICPVESRVVGVRLQIFRLTDKTPKLFLEVLTKDFEEIEKAAVSE